MQLPTRLSGFIAKRGVAATAAAVLMVGGGVAVAQTGSHPTGANESGLETARNAIDVNADLDIEDFCENQAPDAPFCSGPSEPVEEIEPDEEFDEIEEIEEVPEEAEEDELLEDASAFSEWVESIPEDWGCIRGQLVSTVAKQGPHDADLEAFTFDDPAAAAEELGLEGRCVEVVLEPGDEDESELDAAETSDSEGDRPSHAGPPEDTGPRNDEVPPAHANAPEDAGPPEGAGPPSDRGR